MTRKSKTRKRYDVRYWRTPEMQAFKALTEQPGYEPVYQDTLAKMVGIDSNNPSLTRVRAEAKQAARERRKYGSQVRCAWGNCTHTLDQHGRVTGGFGVIGCPCDNTPGWNRDRPEAMGKPSFNVKAVGRHGSRIQRARRRKRNVITFQGQQIMAWMRDYYEEDQDD